MITKKYFIRSNKSVSCRGFSLIELLITIVLVGIISAVSIPSILSWKKSSVYKNEARTMVSMLREARSKAISTNIDQMLVFKPLSSNYRWIQNTNSTWNNIPQKTKQIYSPLQIKSGATGISNSNVYVVLTSNGTIRLISPSGVSSDGNISINDNSTQKYLITVVPTGRISSIRK
jgi:prepilin-type N-terminal cleavage/methylation domain-containing protein